METFNMDIARQHIPLVGVLTPGVAKGPDDSAVHCIDSATP